MFDEFSRSRLRILILRIVLGVFFSFVLARFFMPSAGTGTVLGTAALLVLLAYVLEAARKG